MVVARADQESTLRRLGWNDDLTRALATFAVGDATGANAVVGVPGRITLEHKIDYVVATADGEVRARLPGRMRLDLAKGFGERPAVGDWVVVDTSVPAGMPLIRGVLPRRTVIARKAAGRSQATQVIAANVDVVLIVTDPEDLNIRRIERYVTLVREGRATPVIVLNKADLIDDADTRRASLAASFADVDVLVTAARTGAGLAALAGHVRPGVTVALLGSSGVGKSMMVNALLGAGRQSTSGLGVDGRGRHTTTQRELIELPAGGVVLDTPGMRELALPDEVEGLLDTWDDLAALAGDCRFRDCRHGDEPGCALVLAVTEGRVPAARLASWRKLAAEAAVAEQRQAQRGRHSPARKGMTRALRAHLRRKGRL